MRSKALPGAEDAVASTLNLDLKLPYLIKLLSLGASWQVGQVRLEGTPEGFKVVVPFGSLEQTLVTWYGRRVRYFKDPGAAVKMLRRAGFARVVIDFGSWPGQVERSVLPIRFLRLVIK